MYAEYDVINVRDHQVKKIVGSFHYEAVSETDTMLNGLCTFCMCSAYSVHVYIAIDFAIIFIRNGRK